MTVKDKLACLGTGLGKAKAVDYVIQPPFEQHKQIFSGNARLPFSFAKKQSELSFHHTVGMAGFLLFPQLQAAVRDPPPLTHLLSGRFRPFLESATGKAFAAF
jgi:hypothetical protein